MLDNGDVHTAVESIAGEGAPQNMGVDMPEPSGLLTDGLQNFFNCPGLHGTVESPGTDKGGILIMQV